MMHNRKGGGGVPEGLPAFFSSGRQKKDHADARNDDFCNYPEVHLCGIKSG